MADTTTWTPVSELTDFRDDAVFEIDPSTKQIQVIVEQPIVAGENRSQFIKFQMPRYYDNIDLTGMAINIIYESPTGYTDIDSAVNAEYTDEAIRFGWLVPYNACPQKGTLYFSIEFVGDGYVLKTVKSSTEVLDSINGSEAVPEPSEQSWYIIIQNQISAALDNANSALGQVQSIINALSVPLQAETAEDMSDPAHIYVYTGSETGYTYGNWYYYDPTNETWVSGGAYMTGVQYADDGEGNITVTIAVTSGIGG